MSNRFLDNLFCVTSIDSSEGVIIADVIIAAEHWVFDAHFKDNPLVPGFLQIDMVMELLKTVDQQIIITEISRAKFKKPVYPCDKITYRVELNDDKQSIRVSIVKENEKIVTVSGLFEKL